MKPTWAWGGVALWCVCLLVSVACQSQPAPPTVAAVAPTPTFTRLPQPTAATEPTPVPARPATATPTPAPTVAPTAAVPPAPPPTPTERPTPTQSNSPTTDVVPPTDGPVLVEVMPSRNHFPNELRINDVVAGGYSTIPPTSGQHWDAWSDCGFYNYPLPDELLVHNLEHGNIIVSYNLSDDAEIADLRAAVEAVPLAAEFAIIRRYPAIPEGMVALTTWGVLDRMMGVDAGRIARFFEQFPGNTGPEFANGIPCTTGIDMTPSSGG